MGKTKVQKVELFSTKELNERGWSTSMIKKLLGDPDKIRYRWGYPMFLFNQERVRTAEAGPEFRVLHVAAVARSEQSLRVAERRAAEKEESDAEEEEEMIKYAKTVEIELYDIELDDVDSGHRKVNKIRHEASNYEYILDGLSGPGSREAYKIIKSRLLDLISKEYPDLRGDCDFQRETHEEKMDKEEEVRWYGREQAEEMREARNLSRRVKRLAA